MRKTALLLLLTLPAKAQFQIQNSHTTASLRGIHAISSEIAWASGTNGTVLRTTDGGNTWQSCTTPPNAENLDFRGIQAFDAQTAIVMSSGKGDLSRLYKTTDACKSWKLLFTNPDKEGFWDAIKFNSNQGVVLGDPINNGFVLFRTSDQGKNWEKSYCKTQYPLGGGESERGAFAASNSSLISEDPHFDEIYFGSSGPGGAMIFHWVRDQVADMVSISCQRALTPIAGNTKSSGAFSMAKTKSGETVIVGGDYLHPNDVTGTAAYTHDGKEWTAAKTPPHGYRSAVAYDATTKTWITIGPNGTDISHDDGRNWTPLKPTPQEAPDADKNWNALSLPFVVGPNGRIGKLTPTALKP